jgi:hypothetical protein
VSPDFHYILHGGTDTTIGRQKLFLYDLTARSEHIVLETPKYDSVQDEFSPNSKMLALMNVSIPHRQAMENEGLFLIDLQTLAHSFFPYPRNTKIPQGDVYGSEMKWSKDGTSIYLAFNGKNPLGGRNIREYHRFDVAKKEFYEADGYYGRDLTPPTDHGYVFIDQNEPIPLHDNHRSRSQIGYDKLVSPDGKWTAKVTNQRTLVVSKEGGSQRTIEDAERCACGACTIGITAWLDNGQLLIYRTDELGYCIYNPITEEKDSLFKMSDRVVFTWPQEVE